MAQLARHLPESSWLTTLQVMTPAAGSPTSVRISLEIMHETEGIADTIEAVNRDTDTIDNLLVTEDAYEGPAAFAQKRPPDWRNR